MDSLSQEEYAQLLELGNNDADQQKLKLILAQMENMQGNAKAPQARQYGNSVVAPHWMEYVGALAQQGAANNKQKQATDMMEQQRLRQQQQQALMLKAIQAGQQQPQQWPDATEGMGMLNNKGMFPMGG